MKLTSSYFALETVLELTTAEWRFRSRPDLNVPKLNITLEAEGNAVGKGLMFVAPYAAFTTEAYHTGPHNLERTSTRTMVNYCGQGSVIKPAGSPTSSRIRGMATNTFVLSKALLISSMVECMVSIPCWITSAES